MPIHPTDKAAGARLRILRQQQGFSQDALAKAAGITFQQIQKYEKGINRISVSRLCDLAKCLGIPVTKFFDETIKPSVELRMERRKTRLDRRVSDDRRKPDPTVVITERFEMVV